MPTHNIRKRVDLAQLIDPEDWLGMLLIQKIGAATFHDIAFSSSLSKTMLLRELNRGTSLEFSKQQLAAMDAAILRWKRRRDDLRTNSFLEQAKREALTILHPEHESWPLQVNDLGAMSPILLWVRGDASLLGQSQVAIVGSRACTPYGLAATQDIAEAVASAGIHVTSGGAYGIDAAAHHSVVTQVEGSGLEESGKTIAVLAGGLDRLYPSGNRNLLQQISKNGALVSEMVPSRPPTRHRFLSRNRIIAALSQLTIVSEAQYRSGALSTAHHALDLGRKVYAVPGSIYSPSTAGCHRLIRETPAEILFRKEDVLTELGAANREHGSGTESLDLTTMMVLDALPVSSFVPVDNVVERTGLPVPEAMAALTKLASRGLVIENEQRWRSKGLSVKG